MSVRIFVFHFYTHTKINHFSVEQNFSSLLTWLHLNTNPSASSSAYGYFFFVIYKDSIKTVQFILAL